MTTEAARGQVVSVKRGWRGTMKLTPEAKVALIEYARTHPCTPRAQIAAHYDLSQQRVWHILKRAGVATAALPRQVMVACMECGNVNTIYLCTWEHGEGRFCDRQCRYNYNNPQVACAWCGKLKRMVNSQVIARIATRRQRYVHCSRSCSTLHMWAQRRAAGLRGTAGRLPGETGPISVTIA